METLAQKEKVVANYKVTGRLRDEDNQIDVGYTVQAFDKEPGIYLHSEKRLGKATTDKDGTFEMMFGEATFKEWFVNNPKVYLVVRDTGGRVLVNTPSRENTTKVANFQIKLGKPQINPFEPDLYAGNFERMTSAFSNMGDSVDVSREDVTTLLNFVLGALSSWVSYRDELARVCGYDGIQVPKQPRKEEHIHLTRWDEDVLPI
jgi:hypothetical protein